MPAENPSLWIGALESALVTLAIVFAMAITFRKSDWQ